MKIDQFKSLEHKVLKENYLKKSNALLESVCLDLDAEQRRIVEGIYNDARPLIEAALTADQITGLFQAAEKAANDSGTNRTALGKGKDVIDAGNKMLNDAGKWLQDTAPVKAFDSKFEQIKRDLKTKLGQSAAGKKTLEAVQGLGDYAKANPAKTAFAIGILTAVAAVATGPVGGAIAGQVLRGANELIKGEKLSTAIGKGAKAAALGYLAGQSFKMISDEVIANIESAGLADIDALEASMNDANFKDAMSDVTAEFGNDTVNDLVNNGRIHTSSGNINGFNYNYNVVMNPDELAKFSEFKQAITSSGDSFSPEWYKASAEYHDFMTQLQNNPVQGDRRAILDAVQAASENKDNFSIDQLEDIIGEFDSLEDSVGALKTKAEVMGPVIQAAVQQADSLKATADRSSPPGEIEDPVPEEMSGASDEEIDKVAVRGTESKFLSAPALTESQIRVLFHQVAFLSESEQLDEISLGAITTKAKQIAAKGMQKAADVGKNMTTRVTAQKLQKAWEKAGKPEDSAEIAKILSKNKVSQEVSTKAFTDAGIEVPPIPEPEEDSNIDVDKIIDWVNKQSKEIKADIISVVKSADEKLAGA